MLIVRSLFASAILAGSVVVLFGCGGHGSHVLPRSAGASSGGGTSGAHRRPRTINEAAYPNAVLLDHPAAYYRLDDAGSTMSDSGPNGLSGAYGSAIVRGATPLVPNTIDPGAQFPGGAWSANGMATVPQNSALQPANVSVEAWVSEKAANSGGTLDLVSYGHQGSGQAYTLQISPSNTIEWFLLTSGGGAVDLAGTTVLTPGSAYHIVATYDGANAKIYVNGVQDASSSGGAAITYAGIGSYGLSLGAASTSSRNIFNGTLDDVSIFSTALTSTQVSGHYAAALSSPDDPYALTVMTDSPTAYYRLDDAGTAMYDATNNRINGTYGSAITKRVGGLVPNSPDTASVFPGGAWSANSITTVPQTGALQPVTISIEAWIKEQSANNTSNNIDFVSYGNQAGGGRAYGLTITPTNVVKLWINIGGGNSIVATGATVLTPGTVYHVVGTYDKNTANLYINGNVDGSSPGTADISYANVGTYGLSIGASQGVTRPVFNGTIDEVAIYSQALTLTQVDTHYNTSTWTAGPPGPVHILTAAYYDVGRNAGVSLQYMLRHVDWVAVYSGDYTLSNRFRGAGGMHAFWYTDPTTIYYCNTPFGPTSQNTPGACSLPDGPLGDTTLNTDESAWLHSTSPTSGSTTPPIDPSGYASSTGARLHCYKCTNHPYGEKLYPQSSHARTAYRNYTSAVTNSNSLDATWMDDSSPYCDGTCFHSEYGTDAVEYTSLGAGAVTAFQNDMLGLACAASKPVFFNGPAWDPRDMTHGPAQKAADTTMLTSSCVMGAEIEGTFVTVGSRINLNQQNEISTFIPNADKVLLVQSFQKIAVVDDYSSCFQGNGCTFDPTGDRLYNLSGIWLVYDPRYTLAWSQIDPGNGDPNMVDADGNFDGLVAEFNIVPTQPYQTATNSDITSLQIPNGHTAAGGPPGGAFRREFAQCYQNGASIGRCAVVLNAESTDYTNRGVVTMPSLTHSYSSSLVVNDAPADNGGTAAWTGSVPTSLQPTTAVILKQ